MKKLDVDEQSAPSEPPVPSRKRRAESSDDLDNSKEQPPPKKLFRVLLPMRSRPVVTPDVSKPVDTSSQAAQSGYAPELDRNDNNDGSHQANSTPALEDDMKTLQARITELEKCLPAILKELQSMRQEMMHRFGEANDRIQYMSDYVSPLLEEYKDEVAQLREQLQHLWHNRV